MNQLGNHAQERHDGTLYLTHQLQEGGHHTKGYQRDISRAAHEEVGRQAVENKVDYLVTYGEQAKRIAVVAAAKGLPTLHADTYAQAAETLLNKMQPGDALLVKASRGMALEKVLEIFYKE